MSTSLFETAAGIARAQASQTVLSAAKRRVQANTSGTASFACREDAEAFADWVIDRYNPYGYGSTVDIRETASGFEARWFVGSAG